MIHSKEVVTRRSVSLVIAMIGKDAAPLWWRKPNEAFDWDTPEETDIFVVYKWLMSYQH